MSYVHFSRLCNVILIFPELSPELSTNVITLPLSDSERSTERRKNVIDGLNCYTKQINTKKYNEYIITDHFLIMTVLFKDKVI